MCVASPVIAVVGAGGPSAGADLLTLAEAVGEGLAAAGATVVCGGLGGVMEAVARGVSRHGGFVVGLLPGDDRGTGNEHLSLALPTGLGEGRNLLVVRAADAVIAVGGGYGTLSEVGFALKLSTPVVGLQTWELRRDGNTDPGITVVRTAAEAVAAALGAAGTAE